MTKNHIFGNGKNRNKHEVLVDHANSRGHGITGSGKFNDLIVNQNFSAVGLVQAVKHVHQG